MNFDFRGHINLDPAESQQAEGLDGASLTVDQWQDVNENCTFAAAAQTMIDYGYGDPLEPEQWREIATPGWHGGEAWEATIKVIQARPDLYPDPPPMTIEEPTDVVAAMRDYGSRGWMVHWAGWCTTDAHWIASRPTSGISHAGRIVYADDQGLALWNVWTGYLVYAPDAFWAASYDGGGLLIFRRSLLPQPIQRGGSMLYTLPGRVGIVFVAPGGEVKHYYGDANPDDPADISSLSGPGATKTTLGHPATENEPFYAIPNTASVVALPDGSGVVVSAIERDTGRVCTIAVGLDGAPASPWRPVTEAIAALPEAGSGGTPTDQHVHHAHDIDVELGDGDTKVAIRGRTSAEVGVGA